MDVRDWYAGRLGQQAHAGLVTDVEQLDRGGRDHRQGETS